MPSVQEIYDYLDRLYPYSLQESYDNSGVMVDCGNRIDKVVVSLDITHAVVEYAAAVGADLILSHHPVIFHPIKRVTQDMPVFRLIAKGISALSAHTNFDIAEGGVNDALSARLALQDVKPVFQVSQSLVDGVPKANCLGRMGMLTKAMPPADFAAYVGTCLGVPSCMAFTDGGRVIRQVAVGGGACGEFVMQCERYGVDAFVTGEAKHHEMIYAADHGITLIAAGHYATEAVALEALADALRKGFDGLAVEVTHRDAPVKYARY